MKKQPQKIWTYKPQAPKFTAKEKAKKIEEIKEMIKKMPKLSQKVSKVDMRGNRIYLYELVEQFIPEGAVLIKPLIEGKYLEYVYARITLNDTQGKNCTSDCQRYNDQWMTVYAGTLEECIKDIEKDEVWF